jgi:hypothetical protein
MAGYASPATLWPPLLTRSWRPVAGDSREKGNMPFLPVVTLAGRLGRDNSPARLASPRRLEQDVVGETASPRLGIP